MNQEKHSTKNNKSDIQMNPEKLKNMLKMIDSFNSLLVLNLKENRKIKLKG